MINAIVPTEIAIPIPNFVPRLRPVGLESETNVVPVVVLPTVCGAQVDVNSRTAPDTPHVGNPIELMKLDSAAVKKSYGTLSGGNEYDRCEICCCGPLIAEQIPFTTVVEVKA